MEEGRKGKNMIISTGGVPQQNSGLAKAALPLTAGMLFAHGRSENTFDGS